MIAIPATVPLALPPDPLVDEYNQELAEGAEWCRRVREWEEAVGTPLDALLGEWGGCWVELTVAIAQPDEAGAAERVADHVRTIGNAIRRMESIRVAAARWATDGPCGQFGVPVARLDWSRATAPLPARCRLPTAFGDPLPTGLRVAARLIDLGLTSPDAILLPQVARLLALPAAREAAAWFPFIRDCLAPFASPYRLCDAWEPGRAEAHTRAVVSAFSTPSPTPSVPAADVWHGVQAGLVYIGGMRDSRYDWLANALRDRLRGSSGESCRTNGRVQAESPPAGELPDCRVTASEGPPTAGTKSEMEDLAVASRVVAPPAAPGVPRGVTEPFRLS